MQCPNCDEHILIEDWTSEDPFDCEHCGESLKMEVDEGSYRGAAQQHLALYEED